MTQNGCGQCEPKQCGKGTVPSWSTSHAEDPKSREATAVWTDSGEQQLLPAILGKPEDLED